jgi:phospholipid/cholesterol/gamma-HCH transport system substrate-binding protein
MPISKESKIGFVVMASIAIFYFGYNFLKGNNIFSKDRQFYALYLRVDGLAVDNPVHVNGYKVGRVNMIRLMPENENKILVGFSVTEKNLVIPANSMAKISSTDILGSKALVLSFGKSENIAVSGDTLAGDVEMDLAEAVDSRIKPLELKAAQLLGSIDSAVLIVQNILDSNARNSLSSSFESISHAFASLEKTAWRLDNLVQSEQEKIQSIFSNVESITSNFRKSNKELTRIINNMSDLSDSLAQSNITQTIANTNIVLQDLAIVMEKVNKGEGSLGMLVNDKKLYNNLEQATLELDKLLEDLRVNPKRYVHFSVFGGSEKAKEKPDKKQR